MNQSDHGCVASGFLARARATGDSAGLLAGRTTMEAQPAAYIRRGFVCDRPVTDPDDLHG